MCVAVSLHNGMLPGWCLYLSDSNLGPALPAGCTPALFCLFASGTSLTQWAVVARDESLSDASEHIFLRPLQCV